MPADPVAAAVAYLKSVSTLNTLVSGRVFGGGLPSREAVNMPRNAITVRPSGGGTIGNATLQATDTRLDIACYSLTTLSAWNLYQSVHNALKFNFQRSTHADTLVYWIKESAAGSTGYDPDTDWPVTLSTWQMFSGESPS